jgi:hypothetical protein
MLHEVIFDRMSNVMCAFLRCQHYISWVSLANKGPYRARFAYYHHGAFPAKLPNLIGQVLYRCMVVFACAGHLHKRLAAADPLGQGVAGGARVCLHNARGHGLSPDTLDQSVQRRRNLVGRSCIYGMGTDCTCRTLAAKGNACLLITARELPETWSLVHEG